MQRVAARRGLSTTACMVSSPIYPIGTWLYVYGKRTGALRYCRVTDVSHPRDRQRHIDTDRWVELDYAVTRDICGTTKGRVVDCGVIVFRVNEQ